MAWWQKPVFNENHHDDDDDDIMTGASFLTPLEERKKLVRENLCYYDHHQFSIFKSIWIIMMMMITQCPNQVQHHLAPCLSLVYLCNVRNGMKDRQNEAKSNLGALGTFGCLDEPWPFFGRLNGYRPISLPISAFNCLQGLFIWQEAVWSSKVIIHPRYTHSRIESRVKGLRLKA